MGVSGGSMDLLESRSLFRSLVARAVVSQPADPPAKLAK
jgi:hypothetical protein